MPAQVNNNNFIEVFVPAAFLFTKTIEWRDEESNTLRKVVAGAGLAVSGLGCLVDAVASLALAVLTSPAYLFGSSISRRFMSRTLFAGLLGGLSLTVAQYDNIVAENLSKKLDTRFD